MSAPEDNEEPGFGAPPDVGLAPSVTIVMVAHDPGAWFEDSLRAVGDLEYPSLDVLVVDNASLVPVADRVHDQLPDARVVRLETDRGFGRAVNAVLDDVGDAAFVVLSHDDVAPEPQAVRALVEEAFRSNAAVVGPKLLRWDDPKRLLSAGEGSDKFGFPVHLVERNELDQEQHDAVRDVFTVPDAFTLVRTDLLVALGGFDEATTYFGDDLDLCWRCHVVGARVMVAPGARVRHAEALGERHLVDRRRRYQFRHRMRAMLSAYRLPSLILLLPQLLVVHAVEAIFALLTGRPGQARDVLGAWSWNLRRLRSLHSRRRMLKAVRHVPDGEIRSMQVSGSARIAAFLRGQLATDQDTFGSASTAGKRLLDTVTGPGRREAAIAWVVVLALLVLGSRHLITRGMPPIGQFAPFPDDIGGLAAEWFSSWRRSGIGWEGFAPLGELALAVGGGVFLGATGLFRLALILGMFPLAMLGVWRLVSPLASYRAAAGALVAYAAIPLGYDSLATGSWRGLVAYGLAPWVLSRVVRSSGAVPFGAADIAGGQRLGPGPRADVPPMWRQAVGLGLLVAVGAMLDPLFLALPLLIALAMIPGSLLVGALRGLGRMIVVALGALVIGAVVHAPWLFELVTVRPSWDTFVASRSSDAAGLPLTHVLRFDTGPIGSSALNAALLIAAAFVVVVAREWRLTWAARAWSVAMCCWAIVWAESMGWIPVAMPPTEMILAPAAVALALAVGLGVAAFSTDVRRSSFGWRQLLGVVAVVSLGVALLPVAAASIGGRWLVPRGNHHQTLAFLDQQVDEDPFRVVWFGAPEVLPLASWSLDGLTSYATTLEGTPTAHDLWAGPAEASSAPLRGALELALDQRTDRLGRLLAPMGVRYVVVVDQGAPAPFGGVSAPNPELLNDVLAEQLDLVQIDVNPALAVYVNAAWVPPVSAQPAGSVPDEPTSPFPAGARAAVVTDLTADVFGFEARDPRRWVAEIPGSADVIVGSTPADGWRVTLDGTSVDTARAFGWAALATVEEGGTVEVSWSTPLTHRLVHGAQLLVVLVLLFVLYRTRAERRIARRQQQSLVRPAGEAVRS